MRSYNRITLTCIGAGLLLAFPAGAQTTNAPATIIENLEQQTGTVIVKGFGMVGNVAIGNATISVRNKLSRDVGHGRIAYGIAVVFSGSGAASGSQPDSLMPKKFLVVDGDELDSLVNSMDYIEKITYDATPLTGFEASYATRSGLRFIAHSDRRQGGIEMFIQFGDAPRIQLSATQLTLLRNLITQAKAALDVIK
ncbi:MAG: hypothetical protein WCH99_04625 [Verrucomicrobiota bacterium]